MTRELMIAIVMMILKMSWHLKRATKSSNSNSNYTQKNWRSRTNARGKWVDKGASYARAQVKKMLHPSRKKTLKTTSLPKMKLIELLLNNEKDKMAKTEISEQPTHLLVLNEMLVTKTLRQTCLRLRRHPNQQQTQCHWKTHQEATVAPSCHRW
jgi:hypothetical protein